MSKMVERLGKLWNEGQAPYENANLRFGHQSDELDTRWWLNAIADELEHRHNREVSRKGGYTMLESGTNGWLNSQVDTIKHLRAQAQEKS